MILGKNLKNKQKIIIINKMILKLIPHGLGEKLCKYEKVNKVDSKYIYSMF